MATKKPAAKAAVKKTRTVKSLDDKIAEMLAKAEELKKKKQEQEAAAAAANKELEKKDVDAFAAALDKAAKAAGLPEQVFLAKFISVHYTKMQLAKTREKRKTA